MMAGLTDEQKRRMEENRKKAMQIRAARQSQQIHQQPNQRPSGKKTTNHGTSQGYPYSKPGDAHSTGSTASQNPSNFSTKNTSHFNANMNNTSQSCGLQPLKQNQKTNTAPNTRLGPKLGPQGQISQVFKKGNNSSFNRPSNSVSFYGNKNSKDQKQSYSQTQPRSGGAFGSQEKRQNSAVDRLFDAPPSTPSQPASMKGKCVLISRTRFEVEVGYNKELVEIFKDMHTKQYDPQTRNWSFALNEYKKLVSTVQKSCKTLILERLPHPVLHTFNSQIQGKPPVEPKPSQVDLSHVDSVLVDTLMPFQRDGVNFAVEKRGRVLIADDMGLGKTIQALCVACYYRQEWPLLIVVPSSVRFAWREQLLRWVPSLDPQEIVVVTSGKDPMMSSLVTIISYDLLVRSTKLQARDFGVIIMDESHSLKNIKTARTKAATPMLKRAQRVILLSGTPALSRPSELYTQISTIDKRTFPNFQHFGERYCAGKQMPWGWDFSGSSHMNELQIVLRENIMIRRLKKDVLKQLPTKRRGMVVLDPSSLAVSKVMKASHKMVGQLKGNERRGALLEYFHETASSKAGAVKEYVIDLLEAEHKFLFFGHHQEMLDIVEAAVKKKKYPYIRIDGRTSAEQRKVLCDKFQENDDVKVAILSIMAANAGLNFTSASLVVFGELFWNPGILVQAEDRAHRIGQEDSVSIQYLVGTGTADDYIWPLVQQKLNVLGKAGLTKDDFSNADTKQQKTKNDIMKYFEESFFEDDHLLAEMEMDLVNENDSTEATAEAPVALKPLSNTPCKKQGTLFDFMSPKAASVAKEMTNPVAAAVGESDWGTEDDFPEEFWELDDQLCDPAPKRLRLDN